MPKLKVFRTSIGFHDAYVAAPSRAAALRAWGAHTDLFAAGSAEVIEDKRLTAEPLSEPGRVFKTSRGTAAQHLNALADGPTSKKAIRSPASVTTKPTKKLKPRPSRSKLDKAEAAVDAVTREHRLAISELETRIDELRKEQQALSNSHRAILSKLERQAEAAKNSYDLELARWRGSATQSGTHSTDAQS